MFSHALYALRDLSVPLISVPILPDQGPTLPTSFTLLYLLELYFQIRSHGGRGEVRAS